MLSRRFGWRCWYCGIKLPVDGGSIDHIIAKSRGGPDNEKNYALACVRCNRAKLDDPLDVYMGWVEWMRHSSFTPFDLDAAAIKEQIYAADEGDQDMPPLPEDVPTS
jgi:hypothetical protein